MCGIAGVHEHRGRKAVDPSVALSMLDAIAHRGPDDEGLHLTARIALGARRLSIIDLGGRSPADRQRGRHGRRRRATGRSTTTVRSVSGCCDAGTVLRTTGDTEVHRPPLRGAGRRPASTSSTACSRSRSGTRGAGGCCSPATGSGSSRCTTPHDGERLVFGSEIKALLAPPRRQRAARSRRARRLPPAQVRPGAAHDVRRDRRASARAPARVRRTRRPDAAAGGTCRSGAPPRTGDERDAADELARCCARAVRSHLVSDVPFGAFLSGGID